MSLDLIADGDYSRFSKLAAEVEQRKPAVIIVTTISAARAAQRASVNNTDCHDRPHRSGWASSDSSPALHDQEEIQPVWRTWLRM